MLVKTKTQSITKTHLAVATACLGFAIVLAAAALPIGDRKNGGGNFNRVSSNKAVINQQLCVLTGQKNGGQAIFPIEYSAQIGEPISICLNTNILKTKPAYKYPAYEDGYALNIYKDIDYVSNPYTKVNDQGGVKILPKSGVDLGPLVRLVSETSVEGDYRVVKFDTINWEPGKYSFYVNEKSGNNGLYYFDTVTVNGPGIYELVYDKIREDMKTLQRFALYDKNGDRLGFSYAEGNDNLATLEPETDYYVAVDVGLLKDKEKSAFDNTVHVKFYTADKDWLGIMKTPKNVKTVTPDMALPDQENFLQIKIDRQAPMPNPFFDSPTAGFSINSQSPCVGASFFDTDQFSDGIAVIPFRTPRRNPYYEVDGKLKFSFFASGEFSADCVMKEYSFVTSYNDKPITIKPIVENDGPPLETFPVRLVRIGNVGLVDQPTLENFANMLQTEFGNATKHYFAIDVQGTDVIKFVWGGNPPEIQEKMMKFLNKVSAWYAKVPKVPGKPVLNLSKPTDIYLAVQLYFMANSWEDKNVLPELYAPQKNGEYMTIYILDGLANELGTSAGDSGVVVIGSTIFPTEGVFTNTKNDSVAYMADFTSKVLFACGKNTADYVKNCMNKDTTHTVGVDSNLSLSVIIHELGHYLWTKKNGFHAAHPGVRPSPFIFDSVYQDNFTQYVTRLEHMSSGRDRRVIEGITYGDAVLGALLKLYGIETK